MDHIRWIVTPRRLDEVPSKAKGLQVSDRILKRQTIVRETITRHPLVSISKWVLHQLVEKPYFKDIVAKQH